MQISFLVRQTHKDCFIVFSYKNYYTVLSYKHIKPKLIEFLKINKKGQY